jgi:hypothetical protein
MLRSMCARLGLPLCLLAACGFSGRAAPGAPADAAIDAAPDPGEAGGGGPGVGQLRRKQLTFDRAKVTATLADFPAWIDLTDTDIAARAQADGHDVYFTAADGTTLLDHELQLADAANHRFAAWVRIPTLSDSQPTTIYVNYGDPAMAPAAKPAGVFKASFAAVWHLDDALPATTIADATGTHAGTPMLTSATRTNGKLGHALAWNANTNDRIEFTNPLMGTGPHTISAWIDQAANLTHTACIVSMGKGQLGTVGHARWLHGHYTNNSLAVGFYADDYVPNPAVVLDGAGLTYVVWVFEGNNKKNHLYVNGVEIMNSPTMVGSNPDTQTTTGWIGNAPAPDYGNDNAYSGTIDELRIATVVRSPAWIAAEYANQASPSTFYAVGPELVP